MEPTTTRRDRATRVIGISARTSNAAEADPTTAVIPGLWERFMREDWPGRLEAAGAVGPVRAVYTEYESDASGRYRLLLGRQFDGTPAGAATPDVASIPAGTYLVFHVEGPIPEVVVDGWRQVWSHFDKPGQPRRAFTADLEQYSDEGNAVELWIAVR